jgi:hypothetical protein
MCRTRQQAGDDDDQKPRSEIVVSVQSIQSKIDVETAAHILEIMKRAHCRRIITNFKKCKEEVSSISKLMRKIHSGR